MILTANAPEALIRQFSKLRSNAPLKWIFLKALKGEVKPVTFLSILKADTGRISAMPFPVIGEWHFSFYELNSSFIFIRPA